ncbi:MAG TPA: hypothetical protein VF346_03955 [Bacteroidales bacterium]
MSYSAPSELVKAFSRLTPGFTGGYSNMALSEPQWTVQIQRSIYSIHKFAVGDKAL